MKKILSVIIIMIITGCSILSSFAYQKTLSPSKKMDKKVSAKELAEKIDSIEIVEGTPKRKFQKIEPVWASSTGMQSAIQYLKKSAAKLGADAIIEFTFGSNTAGSVGAAGGMLFGSSGAYPTCQGWAVKWVE